MKLLPILFLAFFMCLGIEAQSQCPQICPAIYRETCGYNGICYRKFASPCNLQAEACRSKQAIREAPLRACNNPRAPQC